MSDYVIRFAAPADAEGIVAIYAPYVTDTVITFEYDVPTPEEFRRRIATISVVYPYLILESSGTMVAYAYATRYRERAAYKYAVELSIYVSRTFHGRGVGRVLYTCLLDLLRLQGFYTLYAAIAVPNEKSVRLHRALGFEELCVFRNNGFKHGRWCDTAWFAKSMRPYDTDPAEPLSLADVDQTKVAAILADAGRSLGG